LESFGEDPRRIEKAGEATEGVSIDFGSKYKQSIVSIKRKYAALNVPYHGKDNDDYTGGTSFCCGDQASAKNAEAQGGKLFENEDPELLQYYYHTDHLGSSSFITNLEGEVVQHLEYVPFGEVFIESKNARWNTPYKFNAKELDEETGLYYYGARYYNPRISQWLSIDPLWEEVGAHRPPYEYTYSNPIMFTDPTGMGPEGVKTDIYHLYKNLDGTYHRVKVMHINDGKDDVINIVMDGVSSANNRMY
ncbi:MAG: hypothetical protein OIF51_07470, partial [Cellvibrionaceae bacterium]|nr:hypothetical protein [Cellvibrionaceae bacterium]